MIRIELVIAVLLSAFIILNGYFQTNLTNAYIYKLVARFFGYSPLMGPFIAVFAAYLWGTDYEYGTLRNKLICGHTREEVYFSNLLLTICAGLSTALIWLIVNGMLGIPLLGTASLNLSLGEMAFYIFSSLLMGRCTLQRMLSVGKSGGEQKLSDTSLSGSCSCNGHNRDAPL